MGKFSYPGHSSYNSFFPNHSLNNGVNLSMPSPALTSDLVKNFAEQSRRRGSLEERRSWINKNEKTLCTICIRKDIPCIPEGEIACCQACKVSKSKCSRTVAEKKARIMHTLNISEVLYDALLAKLNKTKALEPLKHDLVPQPKAATTKIRPVKMVSETKSPAKSSPVQVVKNAAQATKEPSKGSVPESSKAIKKPSHLVQQPTVSSKKTIEPLKTSKSLPSKNPRKQLQVVPDSESERHSDVVPETNESSSDEDDEIVIPQKQSKTNANSAHQPAESYVKKIKDNVVEGPSKMKKTSGGVATKRIEVVNDHDSSSSQSTSGAQLQQNRSDINKFVQLHLIKRKVISATQYAGNSSAMRTKLEEIAADIEDAAASYLPGPQASAQVEVEPVAHREVHLNIDPKKDEKKRRQRMDSSSDSESSNEEEETPLKKKQKMGAQNTVVKRIGLGPRKKVA